MLKKILLIILLAMTELVWAQNKLSIQVKTFDQQLQPFRNIDVSINGKDFINMGSKGVAFMEIIESELPVKTVRIRNEQLEAASWNYGKGILEVIVRAKSYQLVQLVVKDENNALVADKKIIFRGRKTLTATTDRNGRVELPLPLDEKISSANQFSIEGYASRNLSQSSTENVLNAEKIKEQKPTETTAVKPSVDKRFFQNFDLSNLDSIQSLTVFYAVFKNYDRKNLSPEELARIDGKFNELVAKLENSAAQQTEQLAFMGKITDSTFIANDIKNLIQQVRQENQTLTDQRQEFDEKIRIINAKLAGGAAGLDDATRKSILSDLALLERLLIENESKFYKNQNDYRALINAIKEKFFDIQVLEKKLTESEQQRLEDQRSFRQKLYIISAVVLFFGLLIVLMIYFSTALRREKKKLEAANGEINRINDHLEDLVFERTRMLEEANKELDTFLYRASHDMRTPVRSIMGLCNIANMMVDGESKELVTRISQTTVSMDRLLKKLSTISEINQPTDFTSISIAPSIESVRETLKKEIEQSSADLTIEAADNLVIESYPNLVKIIITNMIENAVFYGSANGTKPKISVIASSQDGLLSLRVSDGGIGINEAVRTRIFDMFFKGTELSKGHGLGLYIVRRAVQTLNGSVSVESLPGSTTFTVILPLVTPRFKQAS